MASRASRRVLPMPLAAAELLVSCRRCHTASGSSSADWLHAATSCCCGGGGDAGGADDDDDGDDGGDENGITGVGALNISPT